jgi:lariat debranching enzyme
MKVAVEGCCHGELDAIYGAISKHEQTTSETVDLLLIGGDFQV